MEKEHIKGIIEIAPLKLPLSRKHYQELFFRHRGWDKPVVSSYKDDTTLEDYQSTVAERAKCFKEYGENFMKSRLQIRHLL